MTKTKNQILRQHEMLTEKTFMSTCKPTERDQRLVLRDDTVGLQDTVVANYNAIPKEREWGNNHSSRRTITGCNIKIPTEFRRHRW